MTGREWPLRILEGKRPLLASLGTAEREEMERTLGGVISAVCNIAQHHPEWVEKAAAVALEAYLPSQRRGVGHLWTAVLTQLVHQLQGSLTAYEVQLYNRLGQQMREEQQLDAAIMYHQHALTVAYQLEETPWLAQCHWFLADDYLVKGEYLTARHYVEKAFLLWQEVDAEAEWWLGALANTLGRILQAEKQYDEAQRYLEEARDIHLGLELPIEVGRNWLNLGLLAREVGDFGRAQWCYEQALAFTEHNLAEQAKIKNNLGVLQVAQDNFEDAVVLFSAAQRLFPVGQIPVHIRAEITHNLVYALRRYQKWSQVIALAPQAVAYWTQLDNKVMLSWTLDNWAEALKGVGQYAEARQRYEEALACVPDLPDQEAWRTTLHGYLAQLDQEITLANGLPA